MKIKYFLSNGLIILTFLFINSCSKGPEVKDIVRGIYDKGKQNLNVRSRKIKILTGDTIYTLSDKYQLTNKELIKFNKIKSPYILKPGQFIKIPTPKKYKIKKGDTFYYIAKCHLIDIKDIKIKNSKVNEKKLIIGKIINLPYFASNNCKSRSKKIKTVKKKINKSLPSAGIFKWPVVGNVIANFGKQKGGRRNDGINIISVSGNPVRAALSGKVIYKGNELPAWGNLILIKHKNGWTTAYAHLDKFLVNKGENVKTGDIIGSVGSTGNVVNSQLHFQVRKKSKPLDPLRFLKKR